MNEIKEVSGIQITVPMDTLFLLWRSLEVAKEPVAAEIKRKNIGIGEAIGYISDYESAIGPIRKDLLKYIKGFYGGKIPDGII